MRPSRDRADGGQNYFISFNDLLVGMLFIFILLLITYALDFRQASGRLDRLEKRIAQRTKLLGDLKEELRKARYESSVLEDEGVLRLEENVLFRQGKAELDKRAKAALTVLASQLKTKLPCYSRAYSPQYCVEGGPILEAVYIEGHTDSVPTSPSSPYPDNWYLSAARAFATYEYLTEGDNAPLAKLRNASDKAALIGASAYADTRRIEEARESAKNRRIDFRFLLAPASKEEIEEARGK